MAQESIIRFDKVIFEQEPLTSTSFTHKHKSIAGMFSWTSYTGWRTTFPMESSNYVKYFKTLKGAKRNFIKNYVCDKEI